MATADTAVAKNAPMTPEERKVIFASSLGTVFEWYDFYLYGSLAAIIAAQFFSKLDPGSAFIFALLAFAAGFIVRPFGALVFGRLGDLIGRKTCDGGGGQRSYLRRVHSRELCGTESGHLSCAQAAHADG